MLSECGHTLILDARLASRNFDRDHDYDRGGTVAAGFCTLQVASQPSQ